MRILVTGGAGYIGSHTLIELMGHQHELLVLDNYSNSSEEALRRVAKLSNQQFDHVQNDIRDKPALEETFKKFRPEAVIHFAGLKAVGESSHWPLKYYEQNVQGTVSLLQAMVQSECKNIVFSSSATVYGDPIYNPLDEVHPCSPANPYGRTKYFIEEIIKDWSAANAQSSAILLRYFNPVGAHASGRIGEDPLGVPNNLMPFIAQVAIGKRPRLSVFGGDYDTRDGTGLRDYIHVVDLARAHAVAVEYSQKHSGVQTVNIGTGDGVTVLEMVKAFEKASGRTIPYDITDRRAGDVAAYFANPEKAASVLGWRAALNVHDMCQSTWQWQSENPEGYGST